MNSDKHDTHVLDAESTVNVPLDYHDIEAILEHLPDDGSYKKLKQHLKARQEYKVR